MCPGAVPALSCGVWVSPSPGQCAVTRDPDSSEFASVIYGFVLLLGTPALVCVLPTPGRIRLGLKPLGAVLFREVPARCLQPGLPWELSRAADGPLCFLPAEPEPEKGVRLPARSFWGAPPGLACGGPSITLPFLPVFSDSFPPKTVLENCHPGPSCLCGWEKVVQHTGVWTPGGQAPRPRQAGRHREAHPLQKEPCAPDLLLFRLS